MRMRLVWPALAICVAVAFVCAAKEGTPEKAETPRSYVVNGSFEKQAKGKAPGWSWYFWPQKPGIEKHFQLSKEQAKTGEWSHKITVEKPLEPRSVKDKKLPTYVYFNGTVSPDVAKLQGKTLVFSASVYVPKGSQPQRVSVRLRQWGKPEKKLKAFRGDLMRLSLMGKPAQWVTVKKAALLKPELKVERMDMQCTMIASSKPVLQYVDDVKLTVKEPKPTGSKAK